MMTIYSFGNKTPEAANNPETVQALFKGEIHDIHMEVDLETIV